MTSCPACQGPKTPRHYLCGGCWRQLPKAAQKALYRRDRQAGARLIELHHQIADGVPLAEIRISGGGGDRD